MKYKITFSCLFLFLLIFINIVEAQEKENNNWNVLFHIQGGFFGDGAGYSYKTSSESYPYDDSVEASIELKYKIGYLLSGGFELSKGYLGFQGNFGFTPANLEGIIKISAFGYSLEEKEELNVNTFYGEGAFLFFPTGSSVDKITPYLTVGAGGCKMNGDRNDSGFLISYGGGIRLFFIEKLGFHIGIKGFIMDFGGIEEISGEKIKIKPIQATLGLMYCF
jgi:hypothetical protein